MTERFKAVRPFLAKFATERGQQRTQPTAVRYDSQLAMTVVDTPSGPVPVIDYPDYAGAMTKKMDIEKGEDQKDEPTGRPQPPRPDQPRPPERPRPRPQPRP